MFTGYSPARISLEKHKSLGYYMSTRLYRHEWALALASFSLSMISSVAPANQPLTVQLFESLGYDATESQLIQANMPENILASLREGVDPRAWHGYIATRYFDFTPDDSTATRLAIYYSDGIGEADLQLFGLQGGEWALLDETDSVSVGGMTGLTLADVDCDGKQELVTHSIAGGSSYECLDVVKVAEDRLTTITPHTFGDWIYGRILQLRDLDGDCTLEIEGYEDGEIKYEPKYRLIWKLNPETGTYYLESKEDISKKK